MKDWKEVNQLRDLEEEVVAEKGIRADTLRRLLAKVEEYSERHRAYGLPDDMLNILKDDMEHEKGSARKCLTSTSTELTLENFGPYYGEHTFNFGTVEDRCGILIGGKNGAGKTHLLRALYLAVVGEAGVGDLKKVEPASEATRFIFERSLNRRAQAEGKDTVRLQVKISQHGETGGGSQKGRTGAGRFVTDRTRHPVWRSYADRIDGSGRN